MHPPSQSGRLAFQRPWLIVLVLWLVLTAVAGAALWHLRSDAIDEQRRELGMLSLALTDELDRGLRGAEEGLRAIRDELREGRLPTAGKDAIAALHTRANLMPLVCNLWLVDASGRTVVHSGDTVPPDLRGFLPLPEHLSDGALAVSRPFADTANHRTLVALAMRYGSQPNGTQGWILAAVPDTILLGAFSAALPSSDARMAVFRVDGARLAGTPSRGATVSEAVLVDRPDQRLRHGSEIGLRRLKDGSLHLVGLHELPRYGIKVLVSRDMAIALADWRQVAEATAVALVVLMLILTVAVLVVQRSEQRRDQAHRALQAQVTRSGKLESLGTLAGGVAHDFNNVLAGILGYAEMARDSAAPGSKQLRHLDKVLQAALRGKALVERILAFSRGGAHLSRVFEIEPVVEEVLTLLSASLRSGIVLERQLDAHGACLRGDATQVYEAVMNLCTNAMQAMLGGGILSVQVAGEHITEPRVLSHTRLPAGAYVKVSVSDRGAGITPEVMDHLFEPFFTTRAAHSGTGLGLAVVFGVVAEMHGAVDVHSSPGQGARFTLYLPECLEAPQPLASVSDSEVHRGHGQRLLVVDDEPDLVALAEELLRGLGYESTGYTDSRQALQALLAEPQAYAAVVTDEVMPQLTGTQLTQALRAHALDLPVLLVSAYGGALLAQRANAAGVTRLLGKPLERRALAATLTALLG